MGTKPDLKNDKDNLAVWLDETDDGHIKMNIYKDGDRQGTIVDFNDQMTFKQNWYVYIIACENKKSVTSSKTIYYTGKTWSLEKRWEEHVHQIGSKYMKQNDLRPVKLVYFERYKTESKALKREKEVKKWSRDKKSRKANNFLANNRELIENKYSLQHD